MDQDKGQELGTEDNGSDDDNKGLEPKMFDADYVAGLRQEAAKYRKLAKDNAEKASKLDEIEAANASELDKALKRAEEAERKAQEATLDRLRLSVAAEKGVPASLLSGTTAEDLAASADALLEFVSKSAPKPDPVDFGAGGGDGSAPKQLTREDLKSMSPEDILKARSEGQLATLLKGGQ